MYVYAFSAMEALLDPLSVFRCWDQHPQQNDIPMMRGGLPNKKPINLLAPQQLTSLRNLITN